MLMIQPARLLGRTFPRLLSIRYIIGWLIVATITVIDILWLRASGHSVRNEGVFAVFKAALIMLGLAIGLDILARIPRYSQVTSTFRYKQVSATSAWLTTFLCFSAATCVLSYLCVAVDAPLVDDSLLRFDAALGFNWLAAYHWVHSHPNLQWVLQLAYVSGALQIVAVPIFLGISGRNKDLGDFVLLVMVASILMLIVSTPFPSSSAFLHFKITDSNTVSSVSHFNILRNGTMRTFDLQDAQGLVSMPSFHVALAVMFCYALRHARMIFPFATLLNMTMIVSTPTQGAHYLADVFGGTTTCCCHDSGLCCCQP
jgi:PAP2 superfamily